MKKKKQVLLTMICALLLAVTSLLGTIAYLTSTASITNTFTIGQIDITLDETIVNKDGQPIDAQGNIVIDENNYEKTAVGNSYHLIPGKSYLKDPQITIKAGSEAAYVRMILKVENKATELQAVIDAHEELTDYADFFGGWDKQIWEYIGFEVDGKGNSISFEFRYKDIKNNTSIVDSSTLTEDLKLDPLFTSLVIPTCVTGEEIKTLSDINITLEGHAMQAVGFVDDETNNITAEEAAWEAFENQNQ